MTCQYQIPEKSLLTVMAHSWDHPHRQESIQLNAGPMPRVNALCEDGKYRPMFWIGQIYVNHFDKHQMEMVPFSMAMLNRWIFSLEKNP